MRALLPAAAIALPAAALGAWLSWPSAPPDLDGRFAEATLEDKRAWMQAQASPLARDLSGQLGNGMRLAATRINARSRQVTFDIALPEGTGLGEREARALTRAALPSLCSAYRGSALGRNGIAILHQFVGGQRVEARLNLSPTVCSRHAEAAPPR